MNYSRIALYDLVKKVKETRSGERQKWSGRSVSATTEPIADDCDLLVYSHKESFGIHFLVRKIAVQVGISKSTIHSIVKNVYLKYTNVFQYLRWTISVVKEELKDQANFCHVSMIAVYHEYLFKMRKNSVFKLKIMAKIIMFTSRVESRVWCWAKIIIQWRKQVSRNWWYQQELLSKELLDHFLLEKKFKK